MSKKINNKNLNRKISSKKGRINKKKLILLLILIGIFLFCMMKSTQGISKIVKNITSKNIDSQEQVVKEDQFNLEEENKKVEKKYTIVVDPGHGGNDKGTQSKHTGVYEKDIALQIGKKVANKLSREKDVQVLITRTEDKYVSLSDRAKLANDQNADVLVSIHLNAESGGDSANGIETYYKDASVDGSDTLAQMVQETIVSYIKVKDRGIKGDVFEVIRESNMPSVLVECGFLTNPSEEKKLVEEKYQNSLSDGIVQGVLSFLDKNSKK
ncbi:N-acetylmuramoyl-L-alanine amidase [Romboutsia maritimum]|uniref:N-acetylmuramoyl-L-alanine amidase n=1 Tax=Romboutsia maritimum TaxID=2020948 RepID=A0A371IWZ9_9FIRM|nr:N-acetylmuramoyl-L-alanine amidase [Romboutsia maritimum]RDY24998.1 N-acetylmuramoyl-L-alanine amidase [Romboutsia maritimum]